MSDRYRRKKIICLSISFTLFLFLNIQLLQAAGLPNARGLMINRPDIEQPKLPEYLPQTQDTGLKLPQTPESNIPLSQSKAPKLVLRGIIFEGNTIFSAQELEQVATDFIGRKVSMADLEELRYRLTRYYTDKGYSNSGAIIKPGQIVTEGVVIFQILEGLLQDIRVSGTERLNPAYVSQRIWPDNQQIFNTQILQEYFQLLLYDPLIERIDGRLIPGVEPGNAILELEVERARPYSLNFTIDNTNSPSTGSERGLLSGSLYNLTGYGDQLDLATEHSDGITEWLANFSLPVNRYDTRINVYYDSSESMVVEGSLADIDIENKYEIFELGLSHPLWRDLQGHLLLGGTLSIRENQSFLLGEPFPFAPSDQADGTSKVSVLRLWQDYQSRSTDSVLAVRSTFNFGLDLLDATRHSGDLADGQFFSWLGQFQYAQKIIDETQVIIRADVQLSNDRLLALEQFSLGGLYTIRGYRENTLVRDQAYLASLELHHPVLDNSKYGQFELVPFIDYGVAWNYHDYGDKNYLFSIGMGITWKIRERMDAAIYFAHDIKEAPDYPDHNLQDDGIHFRINFNLL
ncbi:MAG: BamA/TamA family outer membrane protein [gamma proteobacterium symbiont of Taylorina sp.]|nr:BamA/TamA family outer membrane protein [gamma proteobacterium symbiont of Taylorina sp.]